MPSIGQENLETVMIDFLGALRRGDFRNGGGAARSRGLEKRRAASTKISTAITTSVRAFASAANNVSTFVRSSRGQRSLRPALSRPAEGRGDPSRTAVRAGSARARGRLSRARRPDPPDDRARAARGWRTLRPLLDCRAADNLVSHHLRALRAAGLAESRRDGKMALYSLTPRGHVLLDTLAAEPVPA
jgi:DNA-binding transcriptional ArsR family regulator